MIEASCHCGAVKLQIAEKPERLTSCNCSICRRVGGLWAYYHPSQVAFVSGQGTTVPYIQGERTLAMHHCPICGCVTHWESIKEEYADRMGVNARLMKPDEIADVPVRRFDGAETWTYLD
ncbi:MAG TPA: GFA family protein [Dongiaceae bacterium]